MCNKTQLFLVKVIYMQFIGIAGKTDSGKTTVARILSGILSRKGYKVKLFSIAISHCIAVDQGERAARRGNSFSITEWWNYLDYAIFDDVHTREDVENCRRNGVVIYVHGGKHSESYGVQKWSAFRDADLFHGADYFIPKQPSLKRLTLAVRAMVEAGGHVKET